MEVVILRCDRCGHKEIIPYDTLRSREDIHCSFYGELSLPCKCGGRCVSPYRISGGFIIPPVVVVNDKEKESESFEELYERTRPKDPKTARYHRMMGGL